MISIMKNIGKQPPNPGSGAILSITLPPYVQYFILLIFNYDIRA